MSLGLKLLWRAQPRFTLRRGSSLVSNEARRLLRTLPNVQFQSTSSRPVASSSKGISSFIEFFEAGDKPIDKPISLPTAQPPDVVEDQTPPSRKPPPVKSDSAFRRKTIRREIRIRQNWRALRANVLVKRVFPYPVTRGAARRSRSNHIVSRRRQALHVFTRTTAFDNPDAGSWTWALDLMVRHTPLYGNMLDFKVEIGEDAANHVREKLLESDTSIRQIEQRHQCRIWVQSGLRDEGGPLVMVLSGTNIAVCETMLDLVQVSGKISAVRIEDSEFASAMSAILQRNEQARDTIRLAADGEDAVEEQLVTVRGRDQTGHRSPWRKKYPLKVAATSIPYPDTWTTASFEQYVGKLVSGQMPTHLQKSLYPAGTSHQATVVDILVNLFCSELLSAHISVTALKMAMLYMGSKGPVFRPAIRTIFNRAVELQLPLDAGVFQVFLTSASAAGDIHGFNSALRAMVRRGHYIRAENWSAFLSMIHNKYVRSLIINKMLSRGLDRLQPIATEIARYGCLSEMEMLIGQKQKLDMAAFVRDQNALYAPSWLNTGVLNRLVYMLGASGNLKACDDLLNVVESGWRAQPDIYTLNTMITHTYDIEAKISLLNRWDWLQPDKVTYTQFFELAWRTKLPNMLRVIWRYGVFSHLTTSKMRHFLYTVLWQEKQFSKKRALIKSFEDIIFGRRELAAGRSQPDGFDLAWLMKKYAIDAGGREPLVRFGDKLLEAYKLDLVIHKLIKEGTAITPMRDSLTVDIPLGEVE